MEKVVLLVNPELAFKTLVDLNTLSLDTIVNNSDFFSIKFIKLLATDIDVHSNVVESSPVNHLIPFSNQAEKASHLIDK